MKRVYAREQWCVGCGLCEIACKTFHSESKDPVRAFLFEQPQARIRVEGDLHLSVAVNCRHCEHPACVDACIAGAMTRNPETGVVSCDPEKCVGCRTCMALCPIGCIHVEKLAGRHRAFKCDLCGGELGVAGAPSCVAACPNRALVYVESEVQ